MGTHLHKLISRYFTDLCGFDAVEVATDQKTLLVLDGKLIVFVNELDYRPLRKRKVKSGQQFNLIIRQPQELLKKETIQWINKVTGRKLRPETLPHSLLAKIKAYRTNYRRLTRRSKIKRAERQSNRIQVEERRHGELHIKARITDIQNSQNSKNYPIQNLLN